MEIFFRKRILGILASAVASSCTVGPNFYEPPHPVTNRYTEKPISQKTASALGPGGQSQKLVTARDIPAEWWTLFHSPNLNRLVVQGIDNNPNLQAALAALREAEQNLRAGEGQLFPAVGLTASAVRQRFSFAQFGNPVSTAASQKGVPAQPTSTTFNLFNVTANVSYTLDIFGKIRRQIEALGAQVDYQRFQWDAAYLTLTANIVTAAITEASLRGQIAATWSLIAEQERLLRILRQQFKLGGVAGSEVLTQATLLAQTRATLPPLQKSLAKNRDALAALVGELPSQSNLPKFYLSELKLPVYIPLTLPSELVCQRPDVQASEALFHAASAQIGVATANMLPQITLSADYGWINTQLANLFSQANSIWSFGGQVVQPIFQGGTLLSRRRAAIAAYDQAAAQYRQTVLLAFQNVADALNALEIDARALRAQAAAEESARANFIVARNQYKLGGVSYLILLNAEVQYQQTRINRIQAEAARYTDTAALFQALGGGWWHVILDTTRREGDGWLKG
jgi:NodT family efflux transporter outer membrane factor (OMF) lipoprotein